MKGVMSLFPLMYSWRVWVKTLPLQFSNRKATLGKPCLLFLIPLISNELFN